MTIPSANAREPEEQPSGQTAPPPLTREEEELRIGPLLARANLLRVRQQWNDAIAACAEAQRKAPQSAAAHALMGQIYEDQKREDEAITWYGTAVQLDPHNASYRAHWEKLTEAQRTRLREQPSADPARPGLARVKEKTIERTLNWLDQLFPPGQAQTIARYIYAACGVIAVLLLISVGVVYLVLLPGRSQTPLPGPIPTLAAPPVVVPPATVPETVGSQENAPAASAASAAPANPTASPSPTPAAQGEAARLPAAGTQEDTLLREALQQIAGNSFTPLQVRREPLPASQNGGTGAPAEYAATTDISVPVSEEWEDTRNRVLQAAIQAAYLVMNMDPQIASTRVNVALSGLSPQLLPLFSGELTRDAFAGLTVQQATPTLILPRFRSLQWYPLPADVSPQTPASNTAPPAGTSTTSPGIPRRSTSRSPAGEP